MESRSKALVVVSGCEMREISTILTNFYRVYIHRVHTNYNNVSKTGGQTESQTNVATVWFLHTANQYALEFRI